MAELAAIITGAVIAGVGVLVETLHMILHYYKHDQDPSTNDSFFSPIMSSCCNVNQVTE